MEQIEAIREKPKRRLRPIDIVAALIFLVICIFLIVTLVHQIGIQREAAAARQLTGRVIGDIASGNGADARSLGDGSFQRAHSVNELNALFKATHEHTHGSAAVVKQTLTNDRSGQSAGIIYHYVGKPEYYIRITATNPKSIGHWQLIGISGNPAETPLLNNNN